jgi:cholesterol oxidase
VRYWLQPRQLILAAGALGTTYLMLRNHDKFPKVNPDVLGTRFSGNGDLLTFALKRRSHIVGETAPHAIDASFGPVITSSAFFPKGISGTGRGLYIQDGGFPQFLSWLIHLSPINVARVLWKRWEPLKNFVWHYLRHTGDPNISAELAKVLGMFDVSEELFPLLGMGRDTPDGRYKISLDEDSGFIKLNLDWRKRNSDPHFMDVRTTAKRIAREMSARFRNNLPWYFGRVTTVHPLGGCPMGHTEADGVVDNHGQVFNYPGLFIADGSAIPNPVGPNPALTIAALANLFAGEVIQNFERDQETPAYDALAVLEEVVQ